MESYLSEKEQINKIKKWWRKYGLTILICVIVFFAANIGYRFWKKHKEERASQASMLYEQMLSSDFSNDSVNTMLFAKNLISNYSNTPYASLAGLLLAKENVDAGKLQKAHENLLWVVNNSSVDSIRQIARIRDARVLVAQHKIKEALRELNAVNNKAYIGTVEEIRGDIYLSMNEKQKALEQYKKALKVRNDNQLMRSILIFKINFLTR